MRKATIYDNNNNNPMRNLKKKCVSNIQTHTYVHTLHACIFVYMCTPILLYSYTPIQRKNVQERILM